MPWWYAPLQLTGSVFWGRGWRKELGGEGSLKGCCTISIEGGRSCIGLKIPFLPHVFRGKRVQFAFLECSLFRIYVQTICLYVMWLCLGQYLEDYSSLNIQLPTK